ncbi:MAG: chromate transporter [Coprococcus sp.]|nr:chromate transporter [Coprococcus sp.]
MIYVDLFWGFLRVGLFAFGGAYGAIPLIREVVFSYGWISEEGLTQMIAVSESTPGPIMVNLATYIGSSQAGIPGAMLATFAVLLPSFFITLLVMAALKTFFEKPYVQAILRGVTPAITGLILATGISVLIKGCVTFTNPQPIHIRAVTIAAILAAVMFGAKPLTKKKVSPIALILLSACLGIVFYSF